MSCRICHFPVPSFVLNLVKQILLSSQFPNLNWILNTMLSTLFIYNLPVLWILWKHKLLGRWETELVILQFSSCCDSLPQHILLGCVVGEMMLTVSPSPLESSARSTPSLNDSALMLTIVKYLFEYLFGKNHPVILAFRMKWPQTTGLDGNGSLYCKSLWYGQLGQDSPNHSSSGL